MTTPSKYVSSFFALAAILTTPSPSFGQSGTNASAFPETIALPYPRLADFAIAAQIAVVVTVDDAIRLKGADATGVPAGRVRFYLRGTVDALLAGRGGLPASVDWIADIPLTASNRPPKLKRQRFILLARRVGTSGTLQLVARDAGLPWSPATEQRVRAILTEALSPGAPPPITGIGHAFHVAGTIPGEGETQVFLKTADNRPVSLSVVRRPGEAPRWSVALGELVDDSAAAPAHDTLLWYRLACGLPPELPADAVSDQAPADADQARADYRFVIQSLGPCGRPDDASDAPPPAQSSI